MFRLVHILCITLALLLAGCSTIELDADGQGSELTAGEIELTVKLAGLADVPDDAFPMMLTVRSVTGDIVATKLFTKDNIENKLKLNELIRYSLVVKSASGYYASADILPTQQHPTLVLMVDKVPPTKEDNDTININFDVVEDGGDNQFFFVKKADWNPEEPMLKNHVVFWASQTGEDEYSVLLLSLYQWDGCPSANNVEEEGIIEEIVSSYTEGSLSEWRLPNVDEAKILKDKYSYEGGYINQLNELIENASGVRVVGLLSSTSTTKTYARYLCDDGEKTFAFSNSSKISAGGTKVKNYYIRLVKLVQVKIIP